MHDNDSGRRGAMQKSGESMDQYRLALEDDVGVFQDKIFEMTGQRPTAFTYPYGYISKSSKEILKNMGFRASLSCADGNQLYSRGIPIVFTG